MTRTLGSTGSLKEPPLREGTRAGHKVGFYVKLDEADIKPTGVAIPKKYALATYAHHWRKLWTMDRRWPLYQFILRQMPDEYEDLDAPKPPPPPAPPAPPALKPLPTPARLTNEQFAAQVYKIITEKTGINYQEAFKLCITEESRENIHQWILSSADQNTPDKAADRIIERNGNLIERHVQSLTALYEGRDDGYEHPTLSLASAEYRRQVMEEVAEYPLGAEGRCFTYLRESPIPTFAGRLRAAFLLALELLERVGYVFAYAWVAFQRAACASSREPLSRAYRPFIAPMLKGSNGSI